MIKRITFFMLLLLFASYTQAQSTSVKGQVSSKDDQMGLPGVSISIKGTIIGTATDMDGYYEIKNVNPSDTLVFSFIGYQDQLIAIGGRDQISVVMIPDQELLEEVVVTALGVKRQKREIGYSTDNVENEVLVRSNAPNVIDAIVGRSAGVQVSQGNGVDGGSTRITIRGNNNITGNNQPLIVIDNVPFENTSGLDDIGRGTDWGNPLNDINPQDIETYEILKGGAASALYGARGANGVILITLKKGKKQKGLGVSYSFTHKMTKPYRFRDVQNKYGAGGPVSLSGPSFPMSGDTLLYPGVYSNDNLILDQDGNTSTSNTEFGYYGSSASWGPEMLGQNVKWWDGEMRSYAPQPNNIKEPFRDGHTQTHHVSVNGGNDLGTFRLSLTRQDNEPIVYNSKYDRTTIALGSSIKISDKIKADVNVSYIKFNRLNSPLLGEDYNSFSKGQLYCWPRSYQGIDMQNYKNPDGSRNSQEGYPFLYVNPYTWWNYYENNTTLSRDKYITSISLRYDIASWVYITGRAGRDFNLEQTTTKHNPADVIGLLDGSYASSLTKTYNDIYEVLLQAEKDVLPDFKVTFSAGASQWSYNQYGIGGRSGTWYYPNMYTFFNLTEPTYNEDNQVVNPGDNPSDVVAREIIYRQKNSSVFAFLNLSYSNYLFLELTGRTDWSSTLPPDNWMYFYPSASLSFIASDAFKFDDYMPWFNFLKFRGGAAQTATDAGIYDRHFYYNTSLFGGEQSSYLPYNIPPINLKPQRVNSYEGGLSMGFFQNKIEVDFTYYYLYSFDQILPNLPIPVSSGASSLTTNEGIVTNRGIEINIHATPIQTSKFLFKTGLNFTRNRNKVESLGDYAEVYELANIWGLNGPSMVLKEGDEYGTIYGYDYVYHANGQPIVNEDGTKYEITDTRVPIGNASPDFLAGWTTAFSYKGLHLSTLIDCKWGGDIYAGSYVIGLQSGQSPETLIERDGGGLPYTNPDGETSNIGVVLEGVYEDGTPNDKVVHYYYKYMPNAGGWGKIISTPGIVENTWVKMREIALSYDIPQNLLRKTRFIQKLTLSVVGRDLFYIYTTLPDNINPEGIMGSGNAQGFEWASFPSSRSFTFGLTVKF
jgi:iron complex outermembrane receptor protein